jgi:hypothetical protein
VINAGHAPISFIQSLRISVRRRVQSAGVFALEPSLKINGERYLPSLPRHSSGGMKMEAVARRSFAINRPATEPTATVFRNVRRLD